MPVKYTVIGRPQPGEPGSKKKYYAAPVSSGEITLDDLTKIIEKTSAASGADIRLVVYALLDVLIDSMEDGKIVRLGELGSMRVSFSSVGEEREEDVSPNSIKAARAIFNPGRRLKKSLKGLEYKKVQR